MGLEKGLGNKQKQKRLLSWQKTSLAIKQKNKKIKKRKATDQSGIKKEL